MRIVQILSFVVSDNKKELLMTSYIYLFIVAIN
jgi:hypothetical protein